MEYEILILMFKIIGSRIYLYMTLRILPILNNTGQYQNSDVNSRKGPNVIVSISPQIRVTKE